MKLKFNSFILMMVILISGSLGFASNPKPQIFCKDQLVSAEEKNPLSHVLEKYNQPQVVAYRFSPEGLDKLQKLYHQLPVPKIVTDIITDKDPDRNLLAKMNPDYISWNSSKDTSISVNPTYLKAKTVSMAVKSGRVDELKNREQGIALVSWYFHPELKKMAESANAQAPSISELEKSQIRYFVSILDLTHSDVPYLKELEALSLKMLKVKYGVDPLVDDVRLDFHFPYAIDTSTLHLHARANMPSHKLELAKSYSIREVISYLESGKSVKQLILDRQQQKGWFYFSLDTKPILQTLPKGELKEVPNPYLVP